jgi:hypothetical protein
MNRWQVRARIDGTVHVLIITAHSAAAAAAQLTGTAAMAKQNAGQRTVYDTRDGGRIEITWDEATSVAVAGPVVPFDDLLPQRVAARRNQGAEQRQSGP